MTRAYLGLGSNLGDRGAHLRAALAALPDVIAVSGVYESEPVGGPSGQSPYLNLVVELDTERTARELLEVARQLETAAGRVRAEKDGPRTLDVDVLLVGDLTIDEPDLVVPHPRMWRRRFVLAPLAELAEGAVRRLGPLDEGTPH
ncbi:MAG TPA: 2-amino-4-hydroxy-6-hydroxymethyldihydropteridine diphosphokinase [Acidimicrobiales bacterium]|nr:2-amino-4-hydroxy-6-hydroxymethyldihydropteridine diphosphokinase [Acidimicrobiales bacterium]